MNSITLKTGSANHSSPQREPPDLPQAISPAADVQHLVKPSAKFSVEWRREVLALTAALEAATKEKDLAASLAFKLQQQHVSFAHAQQKKSAVQTYCSETAGLSRPVPETVDLVQPASTSDSTKAVSTGCIASIFGCEFCLQRPRQACSLQVPRGRRGVSNGLGTCEGW